MLWTGAENLASTGIRSRNPPSVAGRYTNYATPVLIVIIIIIIRDRMCGQLHCDICKERGIKLDKEHWYVRVPRSVERSHEG